MGPAASLMIAAAWASRRVDYAIVVGYLVGVTLAGVLIAGPPDLSRDYLLGGKQMAWWSVGFSIVASETSTLTFISVPGLAYRGEHALPAAVVRLLRGPAAGERALHPRLLRGGPRDRLRLPRPRFGPSLRKTASSVFIVTRVLASGVRLFATAIPVHIITGLGYPASILLIGGFTLVYTYLGGLKAVVAMDVVQMFIYLRRRRGLDGADPAPPARRLGRRRRLGDARRREQARGR